MWTGFHYQACLSNLQTNACLTETRNFSFFCLDKAVHMVIASAAAVASSSKDELDIGIPVRSQTMVWKFNKDSSLQHVRIRPTLCGFKCLCCQQTSSRLASIAHCHNNATMLYTLFSNSKLQISPPLGNFRLIWCVLGVPTRIFQQIASDDWRQHGVVVSHANV